MNKFLDNLEFTFNQDITEEELKYLQEWFLYGRALAGAVVKALDLLDIFAPHISYVFAEIESKMLENETLDKQLTRKLCKAQHILDSLEPSWTDDE